MTNTSKPKNRLLSALPQSEYDRNFQDIESVPLIFKENIYMPDETIRHVYFPESGIISLLSRVAEHSSMEVGIVGNEGMAGLPVFLGVRKSGNVAVVQGSGTALRLPVRKFIDACADGNKLTAILQRFIHSFFTQISQSAACTRFHPIQERLARWLLMTQDRMRSREFKITQEFLSNMLGVRREAVNKAAGSLHQIGLISYARGVVNINDRKGLEEATCSCYWTIKKEYESAKTKL